MLRRAAIPANATRLIGLQTRVQPKFTRVVNVPSLVQLYSIHRSDAKDRYHFPDERNESLGHSQIFKVSQVLQEDHHQLEFYYNKIVKSNDPDEQRRYQNAFVWELARHSIAEELVIYPALERVIPDGSGRAERDRLQHQEASTADLPSDTGVDGKATDINLDQRKVVQISEA